MKKILKASLVKLLKRLGETNMKEIYLPALRGIFGSWVYYSSMMQVVDLAKRVNFAEELHKDKELSKLIQRELKKPEAKKFLSICSMKMSLL